MSDTTLRGSGGSRPFFNLEGGWDLCHLVSLVRSFPESIQCSPDPFGLYLDHSSLQVLNLPPISSLVASLPVLALELYQLLGTSYRQEIYSFILLTLLQTSLQRRTCTTRDPRLPHFTSTTNNNRGDHDCLLDRVWL